MHFTQFCFFTSLYFVAVFDFENKSALLLFYNSWFINQLIITARSAGNQG